MKDSNVEDQSQKRRKMAHCHPETAKHLLNAIDNNSIHIPVKTMCRARSDLLFFLHFTTTLLTTVSTFQEVVPMSSQGLGLLNCPEPEE